MSVFLDQVRQLRLVDGPQRVAIPGKLTSIVSEASARDAGLRATRYTIGVRCGAEVWIADVENHDGGRSIMADRIRQTIAHEVYDDVRAGVLGLFPDLLELKQSDLSNWHAVERIEQKLDAILKSISV